MDERAKRLALIVATSSAVSESVRCLVVEDDRLALCIDKVEDEIASEVNFAASIPEKTWAVLAQVVGLSGRALRDECVAAAVTHVGYLHGRLSEARKPLWHLARGSLQANLAALLRAWSYWGRVGGRRLAWSKDTSARRPS